MSEIAVISARKSSLMKDSKEGNKGAKTALALADNPDKFLSTIQIGITLIGILTGIYSGDTVAKEVSNLLVKINVPLSYASLIAQVLVVALVTYLTLIFGELVPKRIGMVMPERIAKVVSAPMTILAKIGAPFVWILSNSALLVSRVLGIKDDKTLFSERPQNRTIEGNCAGRRQNRKGDRQRHPASDRRRVALPCENQPESGGEKKDHFCSCTYFCAFGGT